MSRVIFNIAALLAAASGTQLFAHVEHVEVWQSDVKQAADDLPIRDIPKTEVPEALSVPTSARCIVLMCCQSVLVYIVFAACRIYLDFSGKAGGAVEAGLKAAARTVTYGPMLCVLFIAYHMRVEFLSGGTGQPQEWVRQCMCALTLAAIASTLLALVAPLIAGRPIPLNDKVDFERIEDESENRVAFYVLTSMRYLILLALYGGLAGVILGICTYLPPGATNLAASVAPSPAEMCTMILAVVFFLIQFAIAVCRFYSELIGEELPDTDVMLDHAAYMVDFAPAIAILFLAARMRALQHNAHPQPWAQLLLTVLLTACQLVQTMLAMLNKRQSTKAILYSRQSRERAAY